MYAKILKVNVNKEPYKRTDMDEFIGEIGTVDYIPKAGNIGVKLKYSEWYFRIQDVQLAKTKGELK